MLAGPGHMSFAPEGSAWLRELRSLAADRAGMLEEMVRTGQVARTPEELRVALAGHDLGWKGQNSLACSDAVWMDAFTAMVGRAECVLFDLSGFNPSAVQLLGGRPRRTSRVDALRLRPARRSARTVSDDSRLDHAIARPETLLDRLAIGFVCLELVAVVSYAGFRLTGFAPPGGIHGALAAVAFAIVAMGVIPAIRTGRLDVDRTISRWSAAADVARRR
jgi:hypothetical protein